MRIHLPLSHMIYKKREEEEEEEANIIKEDRRVLIQSDGKNHTSKQRMKWNGCMKITSLDYQWWWWIEIK